MKFVNNTVLSLPKANPTKTGNFELLSCQMKPKGVTIEMKALDEYILMALFVLLLK